METATLKSDLLQRKTQHLQALEELEKDILTIEAIEKKYGLNGHAVVADEQTKTDTSTGSGSAFIDIYPANGSWPQRFLFIVRELKQVTFEEAAAKLIKYQPELELERARKNAQVYLSSLYKKGELKGKKVNGLYVYSI